MMGFANVRNCIVACAAMLLPVSFSTDATACFSPKPGYGYGPDKLIIESERIFLVEVSKIEPRTAARSINGIVKENTIYTDYYFTILRVIKGGQTTLESFRASIVSEYIGNDFNNHKDDSFWDVDVGRSDWPCCLCGPDHAFQMNEQYLYFPDLLGARKSAEVIRSEDDEWLKYVLNKVSQAALAQEDEPQ